MSVIDWLLDSDPSIRWQVMRDLTDAPTDEVVAERAKVAVEGWGARLLSVQGDDGMWAGGACFPARYFQESDRYEGQPWTSTLPTLQLLWDFGVDPQDDRVRRAVARVRDHCRWEHAAQPFFSGEVEPCINGRVVTLGTYFGQPVDVVVERLLGEQLDDGGWNCEVENGSVRSSFHTTINVLEGLLQLERATGGSSSYDLLRALDYFRSAGDAPDTRVDEAIEVVRSKQRPDGTWSLENTHPGNVHFELEDGDGRPSRWNTLRAMRVLRWAGRE